MEAAVVKSIMRILHAGTIPTCIMGEIALNYEVLLLQCPMSGASEYCSGFQLVSLTAGRINSCPTAFYYPGKGCGTTRVRVVTLANSAWIEVMMNRTLSRNSKV